MPRDRWVFPHSGTDAHDHYFVSERDDLRSSPAMRLAGRAALELAGVGVDDLAHLDLYSCFPSAVEIGAMELGIDVTRQLTVTGGLSFAGGPWNNYVTHSIATMADVLREDAGSVGLVTANGGFITKHAFGIYSTEPPAQPFRHADLQAEVDALPSRVLDEAPDGPADVESWTVLHGRDGTPETGFVVGLLADGKRAWGTTQDAAVLQTMLTEELAGRKFDVQPDGDVRPLHDCSERARRGPSAWGRGLSPQVRPDGWPSASGAASSAAGATAAVRRPLGGRRLPLMGPSRRTCQGVVVVSIDGGGAAFEGALVDGDGDIGADGQQRLLDRRGGGVAVAVGAGDGDRPDPGRDGPHQRVVGHAQADGGVGQAEVEPTSGRRRHTSVSGPGHQRSPTACSSTASAGATSSTAWRTSAHSTAIGVPCPRPLRSNSRSTARSSPGSAASP